MKYLCLVLLDELALRRMSQTEKDQLDLENWAFAEVYHDSGQLVVEWGLERPGAAVTVRVRNGELSTSDGPPAETAESLHGFYLLEVGDLNEAIHVASRMPRARLGRIELHAIKVA